MGKAIVLPHLSIAACYCGQIQALEVEIWAEILTLLFVSRAHFLYALVPLSVKWGEGTQRDSIHDAPSTDSSQGKRHIVGISAWKKTQKNWYCEAFLSAGEYAELAMAALHIT